MTAKLFYSYWYETEDGKTSVDNDQVLQLPLRTTDEIEELEEYVRAKHKYKKVKLISWHPLD